MENSLIEVDHVGMLDASFDSYGGVIINIKDDMDEGVFTTLLKASISQWKQQGKKAVWLKLSFDFANLVKPAVKEGFLYHHAEPTYLMLVYWIPETNHTLPPNASHRVGVASFVVNNNGEILVVQEKSGVFKGSGVWKLPTSTVEEIVVDQENSGASKGTDVWKLSTGTVVEEVYAELMGLSSFRGRAFTPLSMQRNPPKSRFQSYPLFIGINGVMVQTCTQAAEPTLGNQIRMVASLGTLAMNVFIEGWVFHQTGDIHDNKWKSFIFNLTAILPSYLAISMLIPERFSWIGFPIICTILTMVECREKLQRMLNWPLEKCRGAIKCVRNLF
ncbi:putative hydrolase [Helianthus annuus]|nr:putative hydrolase [Helianthus annuus]